MAPERRRHDRYRFWIPIELRIDGTLRPAVGHDMSRRGALLVCRSEIAVDTAVALRFELPPGTGRMREIDGVVRRSGPNEADPTGLWPVEVGVEFSASHPSLDADLKQLMSTLGAGTAGTE